MAAWVAGIMAVASACRGVGGPVGVVLQVLQVLQVVCAGGCGCCVCLHACCACVHVPCEERERGGGGSHGCDEGTKMGANLCLTAAASLPLFPPLPPLPSSARSCACMRMRSPLFTPITSRPRKQSKRKHLPPQLDTPLPPRPSSFLLTLDADATVLASPPVSSPVPNPARRCSDGPRATDVETHRSGR